MIFRPRYTLSAIRLLFVLIFITTTGFSQKARSPQEFFGYPLGSYFSRHHQVIDYFRQLEMNASENIQIQSYGKTNENRELILAFISSPENLKNLDAIRNQHSSLNKDEKISIVWMSYNVHGNESSATEAAMQTAYELISKKQDWLKNTLVIIDPCINPDGRDRYVNWYNQYNSKQLNTDPGSAEHLEPWPGGRPNHYLFDLNRDWAWLTQKESQQRIAQYNQWLPHVHVDFHEQGINEPYYFAPAAEPYHESITPWQREFQNGIGKNNAKYFDKNGWFYFTREIFDLLYPSYGDTYPTFNGAIGMTYEQGGSSRGGLAVQTDDGDTLTLKDRIEHHHIAGLSTVEYAHLQSEKLIKEFQSFSTNKNYKYKSYILGGNMDNLQSLQKLLDAHDIKYAFGNGSTVKGFHYATNKTGSLKTTEDHLIVSTNQIKGTLVNVLFEPKTKLVDSLTYDITAWSLPYAYGLDAIASESLVIGINKNVKKIINEVVTDAYAYLADWNSMKDARFLSTLLQKGVKVRVSENVFVLDKKKYERGTLIIARGENTPDYAKLVTSLADSFQIQLTPTPTGLVDSGSDFGSSNVKLIHNKRVALLKGSSSSSLNVGEVWHFFEQELNYPLTLIDINNFDVSSLVNFDILIVPEGWYGEFSDPETLSPLKEWIVNGGKVIAIGGAVASFNSENGFALKAKKINENNSKETAERHEHAHIQYDQQERDAIKETITGAIFKCKIESTHPLAFGYPSEYFTLKLSADAYEWLEKGSNVVYLDSTLECVAGFTGCEAVKNQPSTLIFGQENIGNGCLIYMIDNPLFRGFWENGKLFFVNALFLTNN